MKFKNLLLASVLMLALVGCSGVETGHVGVRVWPNGEIDSREIEPGFAQTFWGDVRHYVANDITWQLKDLRPQTADKTKLQDLDLTYTYSVEQSQIVDSVIKYKGRDARDEDGVYYPLALYVENVMTNATTDVISRYQALDANQNREKIKEEILTAARTTLQKEGFGQTIRVQQIFIKNLDLDPSIVKSATEVITAQNVLKAKEYEVITASKEAERLSLLAANSKNIDYMNAKAVADIAEGIKEGKVQAVVVPYDFKGIINIK